MWSFSVYGMRWPRFLGAVCPVCAGGCTYSRVRAPPLRDDRTRMV
ncbi:hypothetical protein Plhal703r1_c39g0136201 [Plasmopara halstedii]